MNDETSGVDIDHVWSRIDQPFFVAYSRRAYKRYRGWSLHPNLSSAGLRNRLTVLAYASL